MCRGITKYMKTNVAETDKCLSIDEDPELIYKHFRVNRMLWQSVEYSKP